MSEKNRVAKAVGAGVGTGFILEVAARWLGLPRWGRAAAQVVVGGGAGALIIKKHPNAGLGVIVGSATVAGLNVAGEINQRMLAAGTSSPQQLPATGQQPQQVGAGAQPQQLGSGQPGTGTGTGTGAGTGAGVAAGTAAGAGG